jgi:hypothetical protein
MDLIEKSNSQHLRSAIQEAVIDTTLVRRGGASKSAVTTPSPPAYASTTVPSPTLTRRTNSGLQVAFEEIDEILGGYDEQALRAVIDKTQCRLFV